MAGCTVKATNYLGWKAEQLANQWVKLEIVPQIGGRLMQVTFGGHDFLYINPLTEGTGDPSGKPGVGSTTTAETRSGRCRRAIRTSSIGRARAATWTTVPLPCRCYRAAPPGARCG